MKSDNQLQQDVIAELNWDPSLNAAKIGVEVDDGIVTLSGHVDRFSEKWAAERAAQKVSGVKAMAINIDVNLPQTSIRTDADIGRTAEYVLQSTINWPKENVKVMVENGWITLTGELDYEFKRQVVASAVRHLMGVKGVSNQTILKQDGKPTNVKADILSALKRRAITDSQEIVVVVNGGNVTLTGVVQSWAEHDMVNDSVWNTLGVTNVRNDILVA